MSDPAPKRSLSAAESALEATSDRSLRVPCYCEENVWRLAYRKLHEQRQQTQNLASVNTNYKVVFVSNPEARVPMFEQLAGEESWKPVLWDYHVLLFASTTTKSKEETFVLDIDSHLPCPCPFDEYVVKVWPHPDQWIEKALPCFR